MGDLHDLILADVQNVFLNTDEFAETVYRNPRGNTFAPEEMVGIFTEDREPGTNQVDGDGVVPNTNKGERIRSSGYLFLSADIVTDDRDTFLIPSQGTTYAVKRRISRDAVAGDDAMQQLLLVKTIPIDTTRTRTKYR
jgi:hypothetical protein